MVNCLKDAGSLATLCSLLLLMCGCETSQKNGQPSRQVRMDEFTAVDPVAQRVPVAAAPSAVSNSADQSDGESASVEPVVRPVEVVAPAPAAASFEGRSLGRPVRPGEAVLIESVIGQISGTPIFADRFFEPIEDQLIALARSGDRTAFAQAASRVVVERIREVSRNQLYLAEAESTLTVDERKGLFFYMRRIEEQLKSAAGGQDSASDERIRKETGLTREEQVQAMRDSGLIQKLIQEKVSPRIIVSWRDVEREYARRSDEFNAPSSVTLSRIQLSKTTQAEQIEQVKQRLAAGEEFAVIAGSVGEANKGHWNTFVAGPGGVDDLVDLREDLKAAIAGLTEGQTSAPVEVGDRVWWIHIDKVEQGQVKSIYEVQRSLYNELRDRRAYEEFVRYTDSLFQNGIYDDLEMMTQRLIRIAIVRYGP